MFCSLWHPSRMFIFDLLYFISNMPRCTFVFYSLFFFFFGGRHFFLNLWFVSDINLGKFSEMIACSYFFCCFLFWCSHYTYIMLFWLSHNSWLLHSIFFNLEVSVDISLKLRDSFLTSFQPGDEPIKDILHFCYSDFYCHHYKK